MNRGSPSETRQPDETARRRHRELLALVDYDLDAFLEIMEECQAVDPPQRKVKSPVEPGARAPRRPVHS